MVERPALTLSQAAQACRVSRDTIKRRLNGDAFPNAFRGSGAAGGGTGPWLVPVTDLLAAGLHLHAPSAGVEEPQGAAPDDELKRLRAEVEVQSHRAELAEARLEERAQTATRTRAPAGIRGSTGDAEARFLAATRQRARTCQLVTPGSPPGGRPVPCRE